MYLKITMYVSEFKAEEWAGENVTARIEDGDESLINIYRPITELWIDDEGFARAKFVGGVGFSELGEWSDYRVVEEIPAREEVSADA